MAAITVRSVYHRRSLLKFPLNPSAAIAQTSLRDILQHLIHISSPTTSKNVSSLVMYRIIWKWLLCDGALSHYYLGWYNYADSIFCSNIYKYDIDQEDRDAGQGRVRPGPSPFRLRPGTHCRDRRFWLHIRRHPASTLWQRNPPCISPKKHHLTECNYKIMTK